MTLTTDALTYYSTIGAALFPVPAGQKNPTGIVKSFVEDASHDPAQWAAWRAAYPDCNFGMVAGHSRLIVIDIDAAEYGRDDAWTAYCKLAMEGWGLPAPPMPQIQSARGGWHALFRVPDGVDARALRQPDALKGTINVRAGNGFVIAAGSTYEGKPYTLISNAPPHPAPEKLIEHCTRRVGESVTKVGNYDPADVAELLKWMASEHLFDEYQDWINCGMALRTEFGDAGLDLWRLTFVDDGLDKNEASHWQSFTTDPRAGMITLNSLFRKAHDAGWTGTVRPSLESMFGLGSSKTAAELAAQVGANLPVEAIQSAPGPDGVSMIGRDKKQAEVGAPILAEFMTACASAPSRPSYSDYVLMPDECRSKKLYAALNDVIPRLLAVCESGSGKGAGFDRELITETFAVLFMISDATAQMILRRARRAGLNMTDKQVSFAARGLKIKVEQAIHNEKDDFIRDKNLQIKKSFDNMVRFYRIMKLEVRFNAWLERIEVRGWEFGADWKKFDDDAEADIRMHASTEGLEFNFPVEFHWDAVGRLARKNTIDPAVDLLAACEAEWDGVARLDGWLTAACGVPNDAYHQMVGRSIIGGMVKRVRKPGSKHDETAVFMGDQGTGKSTLARAICPNPDWFTDSVKLGDESKELVLSLAGRMVAEISEMGSKKQIEDVKAMLTKNSDLGRPAYRRGVVDRPRRNIFVGSTNSTTPLQDYTGNRRFLPILVGKLIDLDWVSANLRQLIGEAAHLESAGETFRVPKDLWPVAAEHQKAATQETDVFIRLRAFLGPQSVPPENSFLVCSDLVRLSDKLRWLSTKDRGAAMAALGFRRTQHRPHMDMWLRGTYGPEAVQFIVDLTGNEPRVTRRLTPAPMGLPGGPPMPPQ
jgi:predicted P-loop ATPase